MHLSCFLGFVLHDSRQVERVTVSPAAGPWKSKEKQSLLIHTAPVHAPTQDAGLQTLSTKEAGAAAPNAAAAAVKNTVHDRDQSSSASTISSSMDDSSSGGSVHDSNVDGGNIEDESSTVRDAAAAAQASMYALEKAYATAQRRTAYQKENAVRSIRRQSARMFVQVGQKKRFKNTFLSTAWLAVDLNARGPYFRCWTNPLLVYRNNMISGEEFILIQCDRWLRWRKESACWHLG